MSIAVPLYGFGTGGGNSLYYSVVCQTAEPAKKEGRIWVKSGVEMTRFEVGNAWTTAKVGVVVVGGTPGGANPTSANKILDLINTKVAGIQNRLKLTPASCKQVQGSVGNWVSVDAYVCHSDTWIQFSSTSIIPEFTYTGNYKIVNDSDEPITASQDNWKIRFLTSGTLTFTNLNGAENGIDVFLVGGGGNGGSRNWNPDSEIQMHGAGGGGGHTKTQKNIAVTVGTAYTITIGGNTGTTNAFGLSASGGTSAYGASRGWENGGSGGSGGGATNGTGGTDGGNGTATNFGNAGTGQGTTTREFGETNGRLYASGGNGDKTNSTMANSGNGADGKSTDDPSTSQNPGASGIVVIRNKR